MVLKIVVCLVWEGAVGEGEAFFWVVVLVHFVSVGSVILFVDTNICFWADLAVGKKWLGFIPYC